MVAVLKKNILALHSRIPITAATLQVSCSTYQYPEMHQHMGLYDTIY